MFLNNTNKSKKTFEEVGICNKNLEEYAEINNKKINLKKRKVINHFPLWWNTGVQRECCFRENEKIVINLAGRKNQKVSKKYISTFKIILKEIILLFASHCATAPKSLES